jgi:hypothetical protein
LIVIENINFGAQILFSGGTGMGEGLESLLILGEQVLGKGGS